VTGARIAAADHAATGEGMSKPATGPERVTWIGRNAEARDLMIFAVSDAFSEARGRLGFK